MFAREGRTVVVLLRLIQRVSLLQLQIMIKFQLFDTLDAEEIPRSGAKGGTTGIYLFKFSTGAMKDDWRADSYRWRQGGSFMGTKNKKYGDFGMLERVH